MVSTAEGLDERLGPVRRKNSGHYGGTDQGGIHHSEVEPSNSFRQHEDVHTMMRKEKISIHSYNMQSYMKEEMHPDLITTMARTRMGVMPTLFVSCDGRRCQRHKEFVSAVALIRTFFSGANTGRWRKQDLDMARLLKGKIV